MHSDANPYKSLTLLKDANVYLGDLKTETFPDGKNLFNIIEIFQ